MIIKVNTVEDLRNPVTRCKNAVNKADGSNSLQNCLLFEATTDGLTGRLTVTAIDSRSHQFTLSIDQVDVMEPGTALVPFDFISDLLSKLPNSQEVSLEVDTSNRMMVKCHPDQFDVFLHQGSVEDYRLGMITREDLPEEVCKVNGAYLTQLIGESAAIITDQEDFKMVGEGTMIHAYAHDRGSNIVSHVAVEAQDQTRDWAVSMASRLIKLVNKYWLDDVTVHLDDTMLALSCGHDFFAVRQLSTEVDVSMLNEALAAEKVGHFVTDGQLLRNKAKLLDLAKEEINVEVNKNMLRFASTYTARGNNDVRLSTLSVEGQQPRGKFKRDLLKKAIAAMEVGQLQLEWVPMGDEGDHFLRFVDADAPDARQVMITPVS